MEKWKVYVKSGKAPKYVTYARLFLGSSAIQTLRSVSFQVSRLLDAAEAKNEFIRVIGDKVLQKLRNLRIRKSFQGLLGLKRLGLIIGRKAVELLLEYNLIYASPSEKRVYANWIAYVRWRLLRPIIGLSNVKTLEDWRKVRGSSILYGLRFLRPFSYFFSRKSISRVNIALARKALLRFQLKDYDKKVEALVGYWKQIYGKDNKYNTEAGQSLWNVLVSLGRNFVGHRVVAAVRKLGRVDPLQFYHMRMSLFQYPRGRLLKYWRVLYKRGGVFSWAFLRKLKKVIFSKNNRAKAIGRFLAFRRKLRPFVGYVFNARFRYIARLYSRSRFAIDLLKEGLYVTPRRLTRVHNEFVRRYGEKGAKLYDAFCSLFIKVDKKGYKVLKKVKYFDFLVGFAERRLFTFKDASHLSTRLRAVFGKPLGGKIFRNVMRRFVTKVHGLRFSRRVRVALLFQRESRYKFIREVVKLFGRDVTSAQLASYFNTLKSRYSRPQLRNIIKQRILPFVRLTALKGLRASDRLLSNVRIATRFRANVKRLGLVWDSSKYNAVVKDFSVVLGEPEARRILTLYVNRTEAFIVRTQEEVSGLERFGLSQPSRPSHLWLRLPDQIKKYVALRNYHVTKRDIYLIRLALLRLLGPEKGNRFANAFKKILVSGANVWVVNLRARREIVYGKCLSPLLPKKPGVARLVSNGVVEDVRICLRRNLGPNTARRLVPLVLHRLRHTFSYRVYNHVFNHVVREGEAVRALISKEINKRGLTLDIDAFLTYGKNLETRFGVYKGLRLFNIIMPAFSRTPSGYRLLVDPARIVRFNQLIGLKPEDHRFTSVEVTAIRGRYLKSYAKAGEGSWPSFFARFFSDTIVFRDRKGRIFDDVALQAEEAALFAKFGLRSGQTQFEMFRKSLQPVHVHVLRATARRWVTAYRILIQFNSNPRVLASKTTYTDTEMTSIRNRLVGRAGFEQGNHQFLMFKSLFYRVYSLRLQAAVARRLITSPVEAITKLIQRYNSDIPKEKVEQIRKRLMAKHGERSKKSVDRYIGRNLVELPAFILKPHWQNTVLPALNQVRGLASFVQRSKGILHESQLHRIENVIREKYDPSIAAQKISLLRSNLIETAVYRMRSRVVLAKVQKHPEFQRLVEMESSKKTRKMLRRLSSRLRDDLHGRLGSEDAEFFLQENERQIGLLFKSISRIVSNNVRAHLATDSLSRISDP